MAVLNPGKVSFTGLGLGPVRSPLLGVSRLITLPRATYMFQFARFPPIFEDMGDRG